MGMDTMRNHNYFLLPVSTLLLILSPASAEVIINPSLTHALYGYSIKDQTDSSKNGTAYEVIPTLDLAITGSWLTSNLNVQSQNIVFDDNSRNNERYFSYNWNNNASLLNDSLNIAVGFNQQNQQISESTNRYLDAISSTDKLTAVSSQRAAIDYKNDRIEWAQINLGLSATRSNTDDYVSNYQDVEGSALDLENKMYMATFTLATQDRNRKFFWGLDSEATKTERQVLASQYNRRVNALIGMPFFWRVSMVATGSVETNSDLEGAQSVFAQYGNYHSLGGGLEWKITDRSWWNVTFNKVTDAKDAREYVGTEFNLTPSKRTSLKGSIDKRFFGRTAQIEGDYKLKHLRMALRVSDSVGSVLGLGNNDLESSLFVCPPGVTPGIDSCFQPPTSSYRPAAGERYYEITDPSSDLSEFLIVRRDVSYKVGYDFNRLRLAANVGQRKDQLIERNAINDNKYVNLTASWQLNTRSNLVLATNYSNLLYEVDGESQLSDLAGASKSISLSLNRVINRSLSANLNVKRMIVDYRTDIPDYQENRYWVGFSYKF